MELLDVYKSIGPAGRFGVMMLTAALERAEKAAIGGDVVEILRAYEELRGCE